MNNHTNKVGFRPIGTKVVTELVPVPETKKSSLVLPSVRRHLQLARVVSVGEKVTSVQPGQTVVIPASDDHNAALLSKFPATGHEVWEADALKCRISVVAAD